MRKSQCNEQSYYCKNKFFLKSDDVTDYNIFVMLSEILYSITMETY